MHARRVCTTWRDAAKKTLVPPSEFVVNNVRSYNAMRVMSTALSNFQFQQLQIDHLGWGHKYGEDPDERSARARLTATATANYTTLYHP
eukprot:scaffold3445_cov80-Skeletonema_marinoi.AAC.3